MRLQRQLLLLSLLLLSLPWAGCQYILGIDATLRFAQEQALQSTTQAIAMVLAQEPEKIYPNSEHLTALLTTPNNEFHNNKPLFFKAIDYPIIVDGYSDEWMDIPSHKLIDNTQLTNHPNTFSIRYRSVAHKKTLSLFFNVTDNDIIYHNPTASQVNNGDRLVLVTGDLTHYVLSTSAPGIMKAYYKTAHQTWRHQRAIHATWQDTGNGYSIEVSLPLKLSNEQLGFYLVNENSQHPPSISGTVSNKPESSPAWLVYQPDTLSEKLSLFKSAGTRIKVIDKHFWPLSQTGEYNQPPSNQGHWLLRKLYRAILKGKHLTYPNYQNTINHKHRNELHSALNNTPDKQWYSDPSNSSHSILSVAVPIMVQGEIIAAVVAEQSSNRFVALTDSAFNQLLLFSLAALSITGLGLLGYASWLSWRIRRLSRAAQEVFQEDGSLKDNFPKSKATDEIGDLTRSYDDLLHRIGDYTHYLQTLSRKLSHELRTPLAIIHSSLDNLEHCELIKDAQTYHLRAKDGANRLGNIITAMSEATRVEQSIQNAEPETINLAALLYSVTAAYDDLHKDHHIQLSGIDATHLDKPSFVTHLVPDLIVQMLDKLIDNAVDFCPKQGNITLDCQRQKDTFVIKVSNEGPLLPTTMQHQLFDNMVSLREEHSEQSHLGLGLYIVSLIVQYHHGKISATNQTDGSGVEFNIVLPRKKPAEAGNK
ncbi:MAG: GHKL domain-containing protein [Spongiibacteraceae bacterium]|nr:GHKL domain-containing protein [Spongiibacteraceae bacterium]